MIGVMGGSYNPVHIGHLMVADYVRQVCSLDKVLMMLSPLNPLKVSDDALVEDRHRMAMLEIACRDTSLEACDLELSMPKPSYTINTLRELRRLYPGEKVKLVIGSDNWLLFDKWRASEEIIADYGVIVYPRPGYEVTEALPEGVMLVKSPTTDLSSTFIRRCLSESMDMNLFLPHGVYKYIVTNNLYR